MRPFDVKRVGNYGFLFLETDPSTSDELDFLMRSDLKEFLPLRRRSAQRLG
ncbi:MAG: hypothetical protein ACLSGS_02465 [Adlercreutzia sp.]